MIPNAILLGLVGGLVPRFRWWSTPVIGVIWSVTLSIGGDPSMSLAQIWIAGFVLGALNGAVGVVFTWGLSRLIHIVSSERVGGRGTSEDFLATRVSPPGDSRSDSNDTGEEWQ